ncbi:hypothetical protein EDC65_5506 [Stella humosa]|uniref:Antitoxin FitA-like ribbon-helix-helix domain-containing protein n=1 Tax=Stella humosa TaxID=94 RepID=A0A3N1KRX9_9PROT|nr:hypothetical protein [Stella humosa]ROP80856.1 hypothetical protein EDC65_5506 [Stella humosa]BBK33351.1 hypothetical protein STHU_39850 [Stella humosa]
MGQILVRNLDDLVIERLKHRARLANLSLEQQVREILQEAARPNREQLLAEMDRIRATTRGRITVDSTDVIREERERR